MLQKLYLDTSIISHLDAQDTPDKMRETLLVWDYIKSGKYNVVISKITLDEIEKCAEPKRSKMLESISKIKHQFSYENDISTGLADEYIKYGVLTDKSKIDLRHVVLAVVLDCEIILSWNFKHLVKYKTIKKVREINKLLGYNEIDIVSPNMLIDDVDFVSDPNIDYIHQIRNEIYEETKNMSNQELIEITNLGAQKAIDEIERIRKNM
jgi:hypothetical protein